MDYMSKTEICGRGKFLSWYDRIDWKMIDLKIWDMGIDMEISFVWLSLIETP